MNIYRFIGWIVFEFTKGFSYLKSLVFIVVYGGKYNDYLGSV
jgi:hypothetical protein